MPFPEGLSVYTIWDEIAYFIESPKDLLSLAQTCRTFKELVISDHLKYRYISCDIRRKNLWTFLASRPRLARGIRALVLVEEHTLRFGRSPGLSKPYVPVLIDSYDECRLPVTNGHVMAFRNALLQMVSLKKFTWTHGYVSPDDLSAISQALTNTTHCLEALSVYFRWLTVSDNINHYIHFEGLSIWTLTGLTEVILRPPVSAAIQAMPLQCLNLESLCLEHLPDLTVLQVMRHADWKTLRRLSIYQTHWTQIWTPEEEADNSTTIVSFFERHSNLETLYLHLAQLELPKLPSTCLPNLRSFGWDLFDRDFVLTSFLPDDILSHLVHLFAPIAQVDTLPRIEKLETCTTFFDDSVPRAFIPLILNAPNLKKICVQVRDLGEPWSDGTQETLIEVFLKCSDLTHLLYEFSLPWVNHDDDEILECLSKRLSVLRSLTCFPVQLGRVHTLVKLERDEGGLYIGYRWDLLQEDPMCWANFFG